MEISTASRLAVRLYSGNNMPSFETLSARLHNFKVGKRERDRVVEGKRMEIEWESSEDSEGEARVARQKS